MSSNCTSKQCVPQELGNTGCLEPGGSASSLCARGGQIPRLNAVGKRRPFFGAGFPASSGRNGANHSICCTRKAGSVFPEMTLRHEGMRELVRELAAGGFFEGWRAAPRVVPSAEASGGTAFLQISVGCPHNGCIFCPFFKDVAFSQKPLPRIEEEVRFVAAECSRRGLPVRRVMLLDADALCTEQARLEQVLRLVRAHFPGRRVSSAQVTAYDELSECLYFRSVESWVEPVEVSAFCHTESVLAKGVDGLRRLRELGLGLLWWGLESGSARLLRLMRKTKGGVPGTERERFLAAGETLREAGIHFVAIILVGLGGERFYDEHLQETLSLLRQLDPPGVSFSDLVVVAGTGYAKLVEAGLLDVLPPQRMAEQRRVFEQSDLAAVQYDYELAVNPGNERESGLGSGERLTPSPAATRHFQVTGNAVR